MSRNEILFVAAITVAAVLLLLWGPIFAVGLGAAGAIFVLLWLVSLPLHNASIVDAFWGPACAGVGWVYYSLWVPRGEIGLLVCILTTVWGIRLAAHIAIRNAGAGEDFRYLEWREQSGAAFWWVSLFKVFLLQAVVLWVVSSPLALAQGGSGMSWLVAGGLVFWLVGFAIEVVADWQLSAFRRDSANRGRVLRSGLWGLSRHPNYFGEAVLWWGIGLTASSVGGVLAFVGPALLTFTLLRISGVAMLDRALVRKRPGYAEYIESTPAFMPVPRALRRRNGKGRPRR